MRSPRLLLATLSLCAGAALGCADVAEEPSLDAPAGAAGSEQTPAVTLEQQNITPNVNVKILDNPTVTGSGCAPGTYKFVSGTDVDGRGYWEIRFSDYKLEGSTTADVTQIKECKIQVKVEAPPGFAAAVASVTYIGHTLLEAGQSANVATNVGFPGRSPVANSRAFTGPTEIDDTDWSWTDEVRAQDLFFTTCGINQDLHVNTRTRLVNSTPRQDGGDITFKKINGSESIRVTWALRACTLTPPRSP